MNDKLLDTIEHVYAKLNTSDLYYGHGTENAWDEAVALVYMAADVPPDQPLDAVQDIVLDQEVLDKINAWTQLRLTTRQPLPYISHLTYFAGLPFYVDSRVIVPKSPLAEWIQNGGSPWVDPGRVHHVLDLCTGSGCIAIACAYYFDQAQVVASDLSKDALEVAKINIEKHGFTQRVHACYSDLFKAVDWCKFDLIISNPPYVGAQSYGQLPREYQHEPEMALISEGDGLLIPCQILAQAADYLSDQGVLLMEVGESWEALSQLFGHVPWLWVEFEHGGEGVLLITRQQLLDHRADFEAQYHRIHKQVGEA